MARQSRDGAPSPGLRERKKLATREALSQAAVRLAVERGVDRVLVEDIAAEAGVSPRTFHNYFGSKVEAIAALGVDRTRRIGADLLARPPAETLWVALTEAMVRHYSEEPPPDRAWVERLRLMVTSEPLRAAYGKVNFAMQDALAAAIAARTGADAEQSMAPAVAAAAAVAAAQVAVGRWFQSGGAVPLPSLVRAALGQLAAAVSPPAGR